MNGGVSSRSYSSSPLSSAPLAPSSTSKGRKRSKSGATRSKGAKKTSSKYSKSGKPSKKLKLSNQEASTASAFSSSNADFGSHNQPYYNVDTGRVEHAYGNDASIDNSSYVEGKRAAPPLRYNEGKRAASSITNYKNSKRKSSGSGSSDGNRGKAKKCVRSLRQSTVSDSRQVKPISSFNQDINIFEYM